MDPKTIFITGGTGLVGSHAVQEAIARGHRVRVLARASSDTRLLDAWGVEKIVGDLADSEALRQGVAGADWVFNCAAKVGDWGTLEEFRLLNVDALQRLLDACAEARVQRLVHVSSLGVYEGRDHFGTDETTPPAIQSLDAYTRSKNEAEALVLAYAREGRVSEELLNQLPYVREVLGRAAFNRHDLSVVIVRPGFIYGERDRTVLPKLLDAIRKGRFVYFGSGEQAMNCIYVKNLVHAIFLAAESSEADGETFNVTDGEPVSKRRFVSRVAELAGYEPPRKRIPRGLARILANVVQGIAKARGATRPPLINKARYKFIGLNLDFSIDKARRVLGYEPLYSTDDGLTRAVADMMQAAEATTQTPASTT